MSTPTRGHRSIRATALTLLLPLFASTACDSPTKVTVHEDTFDENSLADYTTYADYVSYLDSTADWKVIDGWLENGYPASQSVLIRNGVDVANGWVETTTDRADDGGLVIRFQDPLNYYVLAIRDDSAPPFRDERNLELYARVGGEFEVLWRDDFTWPRGERRTIRLEARGDELRIYWNGEQVHSDTYGLMPESGGIGLRDDAKLQGELVRYDVFRWGSGDPSS